MFLPYDKIIAPLVHSNTDIVFALCATFAMFAVLAWAAYTQWELEQVIAKFNAENLKDSE